MGKCSPSECQHQVQWSVAYLGLKGNNRLNEMSVVRAVKTK